MNLYGDDGIIGISDLIENIGDDLGLFNPVNLSAKTGYGSYKLKTTMIGRKLYSQYLSGRHHATEVTRAQEADTSIIAADIHT